jgi:hypothetical protein
MFNVCLSSHVFFRALSIGTSIEEDARRFRKTRGKTMLTTMVQLLATQTHTLCRRLRSKRTSYPNAVTSDRPSAMLARDFNPGLMNRTSHDRWVYSTRSFGRNYIRSGRKTAGYSAMLAGEYTLTARVYMFSRALYRLNNPCAGEVCYSLHLTFHRTKKCAWILLTLSLSLCLITLFPRTELIRIPAYVLVRVKASDYYQW